MYLKQSYNKHIAYIQWVTNKQDIFFYLEIKNKPNQCTFFVCIGAIDNNKNKKQMKTEEGCKRPPSEK